MSKYNELSDFEINLKVAHIILGVGKYDWCDHTRVVKKYITDDKGLCMDYNPCNNPSDAMPIINKYGISLIYQDGKFQFATHDGNIECCDNNPLRASMIVLLCMLDGDYES
ncbi:DUF2591 domain containing protein [Proteus phage vB_PmiS_PM-CJR]|nr:DUF2591 domain containing protein [Proteus phage vB_PmiS_PM-CJR]